jgi:hypothetical protein
MIDPPKRQETYPDRSLDCEAALETGFHILMAEAVAVGWTAAEIRRAIGRLMAAEHRAEEEEAKLEAYLKVMGAMERKQG